MQVFLAWSFCVLADNWLFDVTDVDIDGNKDVDEELDDDGNAFDEINVCLDLGRTRLAV